VKFLLNNMKLYIPLDILNGLSIPLMLVWTRVIRHVSIPLSLSNIISFPSVITNVV
jgi:hypothetical protein